MKKRPLALFEAFGIELEYMIIDRESKRVRPIAESILLDENGESTNEISIGEVNVSNELATHVLEFKTGRPTADFEKLAAGLRHAIGEINKKLLPFNAILAPGGIHPFMNPKHEGKVWTKGNRDIYATYDRIFNCHGHGWFNLQSCHLNLPFANEEEFGRLHAAVILILPFLPALTASSPYIEGAHEDFLDTRLSVYSENQRKIPEIIGSIVPEAVFTFADYQAQILEPAYRAIAPHDPEKELQYEWLNSRGAIARFERNAIEIRVLDTQENPLHDIAICSLIIALLERLCSMDVETVKQAACSHAPAQRREQLMAVAKDGYEATLTLRDLPDLLDVSRKADTVGELWKHILDALSTEPRVAPHLSVLEYILQEGNLSERMLSRYGKAPTLKELAGAMGDLSRCLQQFTTFSVETHA